MGIIFFRALGLSGNVYVYVMSEVFRYFRVLLVILHDFPELLCEYHYVIIDTIPPNCVQLRNLVLSAYPRNMRLPDPFALNFKVCRRERLDLKKADIVEFLL